MLRVKKHCHYSSVGLFREAEVLDAARVQNKPGNVLVGVARETHRADVASKNVAHRGVKRVVLILQPRKRQIPILKDDAVDGINFFADVGACKFG